MTKYLGKLLLCLSLLSILQNFYAQDISERSFTVNELFEMVKANHPTLKVYR